MNDLIFMINAHRPSTDSNIEFIYKLSRKLQNGKIMDDDTVHYMLELAKMNIQQIYPDWKVELVS